MAANAGLTCHRSPQHAAASNRAVGHCARWRRAIYGEMSEARAIARSVPLPASAFPFAGRQVWIWYSPHRRARAAAHPSRPEELMQLPMNETGLRGWVNARAIRVVPTVLALTVANSALAATIHLYPTESFE